MLCLRWQIRCAILLMACCPCPTQLAALETKSTLESSGALFVSARFARKHHAHHQLCVLCNASEACHAHAGTLGRRDREESRYFDVTSRSFQHAPPAAALLLCHTVLCIAARRRPTLPRLFPTLCTVLRRAAQRLAHSTTMRCTVSPHSVMLCSAVLQHNERTAPCNTCSA